MKEWYYALDGRQNGPVSLEQLRQLRASGSLHDGSLVWREGMAQWTPYGQAVPPGDSSAQQPAFSAPADALGADTAPARHVFQFTGGAGEFFRIWIVNVVLTVLTLGIYAAWAKVRTRRYFYGNLLLDGKPFDFTGDPVAILKGNLVFGGLFILYAAAGSIFPPLALAVMLLILLLAPWLVHKALRFRARSTVHRGVRFRFRGSLGESYMVFLGLLFLAPFTLGLIIPYIQFRQRRFFFGNMAWGGCEASMEGRPGFFYLMALKVLGLLLLAGAAISLVVGAISMNVVKDATKTGALFPAPAGVASAQLPNQAELEKAVDKSIEQALEKRPGLSEEEKKEFRERAKKAGMEAAAVVYMAILPAYALMILIFLYYQVRVSNYCINSTQWGALGRLESTVRARDLLWLYFTNGLAVLLSLGLLIPWVQVRMARYRASRTVLLAAGSLDAVSQAAAQDESAMGDAGADIFDLEIGF